MPEVHTPVSNRTLRYDRKFDNPSELGACNISIECCLGSLPLILALILQCDVLRNLHRDWVSHLRSLSPSAGGNLINACADSNVSYILAFCLLHEPSVRHNPKLEGAATTLFLQILSKATDTYFASRCEPARQWLFPWPWRIS